MRSRHHRLRASSTVAALALLGGWAGLSSASAAQVDPLPISPHQTFVGQVNGVTFGAVIKVGCFGPVSLTQTGHPLSGQTVSVALAQATTPASAEAGYTGESGTRVVVGFGGGVSVAPITQLTAYGVRVVIPQSLNLPCSGTGKVAFVPAPTSGTAHTATVEVTYVAEGYSPSAAAD